MLGKGPRGAHRIDIGFAALSVVESAGEGGDLAGEAAQVGAVVAGPVREVAMGGAAVAGGSDALFAGASGGSGALSQVAAPVLGCVRRVAPGRPQDAGPGT
ncbi:hypothetical protein OG349_25040 [Streptomyces sp. NBC_01317]|uniref:hypothetical protein n=1 Tax=Streptomyces sp. NBC_01317 TaxID=2903822 RepID=UPI002E0F9D75|nr:hypothetical protein OG349_25040 [Streptomyces sp. NBC_01317]